MAEDSGQEKTEDPTPKRLKEAREKGDVPRSKELNTMLLLLVAASAVLLFGSAAITDLGVMMVDNFTLSREEAFDEKYLLINFGSSAIEAVWAVMAFMAVVLVAALVGPISLGGWNFSTQAIAPKASRMDPLAGLKRMFSLKSLVELAKAIGKFLTVTFLALYFLDTVQNDLYDLGKMDVFVAMSESLSLIGWAFLIISLSLIIIALADVPYVLYESAEKLKMTLQEVKDEMKNTEGKPEVKGRIRQLQREISQRQMMKDVPQADVVITNPTHYSVALKYEDNHRNAPIIVAKGADFIALKIREVAKENDVPILQSPPLARALYYSSEIGDEVPTGLFKAVAQVLAYVFQLKRHRLQNAEKPTIPKEQDIEIPNEFRQDS
ncbi:MAG: flagellar biosynthesis protein FlhB [Pseudomonadales bacterium]|nr:flagellar biosynthesis protein FlhB [Pseudomonadales bacterium]NRA18048.1 flagellar biosynthesis protein FlhB [Oceanospirillaceae bacterium]